MHPCFRRCRRFPRSRLHTSPACTGFHGDFSWGMSQMSSPREGTPRFLPLRWCPSLSRGLPLAPNEQVLLAVRVGLVTFNLLLGCVWREDSPSTNSSSVLSAGKITPRREVCMPWLNDDWVMSWVFAGEPQSGQVTGFLPHPPSLHVPEMVDPRVETAQDSSAAVSVLALAIQGSFSSYYSLILREGRYRLFSCDGGVLYPTWSYDASPTIATSSVTELNITPTISIWLTGALL